jgi:hypothetical protein
LPDPPALASSGRDRRIVEITAGAIKNRYISVPLDFFPDGAVGGSGEEQHGRLLTVTFLPGTTVETDIVKSKKMFRRRAAVGNFFAEAEIVEGDSVTITRCGADSYLVEKTTA